MSGPRPFDVCGPLPAGVTLLEASAGTGKTYTIAALAARYVAEGTPLHELLLVTFTRMATGELRDRVRERLVAVEHGLERALAGAPPGDDEVTAKLADGPVAEVQRRRGRLARALADFDAATIATTHGFCQEVLGGLGIAGEIASGTAFVEDLRDLLAEVVDDLYVRRFHRDRHNAPFDRAEALQIAQLAVDNPAARIEPEAARDGVAAMRVRLAHAARDEFSDRKRRMAVMTYDDLLTLLRDALTGPGGPAIAARLRARFRVVLVDEFQDTDPVQWEIMRRAFGEGGGTLVLIGDPKQAIYAFRGADVYAYLKAAKAAASRATLQVNWRSDQGLIDAYDALFAGARLGHEGIVYRTVRAVAANATSRLVGAPAGAPLRVRIVDRAAPAVGQTPRGFARAAPAREHVAADVAADLVTLLSSGAQIEVRSAAGAVTGRERVRPGHVAVLVRRHRSAADVRDALEAVGVPAVVSGAGSVFATKAAREWLDLLAAIERPSSATRARSVALTCFMGWGAEAVAVAGDDAWEEVHRRLHEWARVLRERGVASLVETITLTEGLPGRVLACAGGERRLTDLRHVGQLLHAAATAEHLGTTALTSWLRRRIAEADADMGDEERSRRLESDAEAVQILTIHRSKGLEFPIVYCPYLWEPAPLARDPRPIFFHDPAQGDARTIDVGLTGPDWRRHLTQHEAEERGEDLRLAYVALTRARHQAVVWWAGSYESRHSALNRLLFARAGDAAQSGSTDVPSDREVAERLGELAAQARGAIAVERAELGLPARWTSAQKPPANLDAASFGRRLDLRWRRTSFSDMTADTHEPRVASEPEQRVVDDERVAAAPPPTGVGDGDGAGAGAAGGGPLAVPSPLAAMPAGIQIGTFVHRVLEATDFAAADLDAELRTRIAETQARRPLEIGEPAAVVAGLRAALQTPLGPLLGGGGGVRLCDIPRCDRLDELDFELPLAGGDEPAGRLALDAVGGLLRAHLAADDPLAGYADRLGDPVLRSGMRGYLTGSIDLVARVGSRFAVVDYKTNWLAPPGEELTLWHHRPSALAAEMVRAHYALQALLYTAALHRYLRWRLPGYDPERNLAGVLYLFVRGMGGAGAPACGVFGWRAPPDLVVALSDALDRGGAA